MKIRNSKLEARNKLKIQNPNVQNVSDFGFRASNFSSRGQVMLLTVLVLSATLLSVTAIAGLLTFYQIKQATNVKNSVKAIYAAETGLELELYRWEKDRADCHGAPLPSAPVGVSSWSPGEGDYPVGADCHPAPTFENGAVFDIRVTYGLNAGGETQLRSVKSTGQSGTAARALQVQF